jgi:hypothetical protein
MNATDFITRAEFNDLRALADKQERICCEKVLKLPSGSKYTIAFYSGKYYGTDEYFVSIHYYRHTRRIDGGWDTDGGTWHTDFKDYESVKEDINQILRRCPDFDETEQMTLF